MLYRSKENVIDDNKKKIIEFREGNNGSGNPVYIIVTYIKTRDNFSYYHEEWFDNIHEADCWYNLTN